MNYLTPPWEHQRELVERRFRGHKGFGIFWEMGTGKTKATIDCLRYRFGMHKEVLPTLILGPPIVVQNWVAELKVHSKIPNVIPLQGPVKKRLERAKKAPPNSVLITNYEALNNERFFTWLKKEFKPQMMVLDEAHKIKNPTSKRFKRCISLSDHTEYRLALTGTPILNNQKDMWALFRFIDKGESMGRAFTPFVTKYFIDLNAGMPRDMHFPNWQFRPSMQAELEAKIKAKSMAVTKEECLDLPPLVRKVVQVEMSTEQAKAYKEMKRDFIAFIRDHRDDQTKPAVASLALTKTLRLLQISSGFATVEDGTIVEFKDNPKIKALEEIIEDAGRRKFIVWATFKQDYKAIRKLLDKMAIKYVECHGDISQKDRDIARDSFQADDSVIGFLGNPQSGGIGINLTKSDLQIHYSRGFSLESDRQSEARNHRGGSDIHERITRIDLVASDIDEYCLLALRNKEAIGARTIFGITDGNRTGSN